ncbi:uncharacterized protein LOC129722773 isoform X2 [Wyeomyia smithii]|uniref:uncharacterized protein LOC129722773 isoform X2 n=1 Tax=Wyeomyia smithii TaxID=174621 RepID=UPI002467F624|nr:uncharacterized protein LOC129722773 isoform X2 [Wyeomyia smithii]
MAKGARKKTKWVSLSLASATATTAPPATNDNDADEKLKSSRGRKTYTAVVRSDSTRNYFTVGASNSYSNGAPNEETPTENGANVSIDRERPTGENRNSSPNSNSRLPYSSHRNHMRYSKNHFSSHNSHYHHNSSSNSNGKSYYSHHNGGGPYSNRSSAYSTHYTAESKNEQNETVTINEEEYTKITTPRQDVLFKKGYLSRPKRHTSTANDSGALSSSMNGSTPTDGSDTATGSGSVSTAESVMSDATYLTEGHFLEYPTPYFGYFDPSGVLVMNGFAVDNNGFSYMNGGQTYIYPPNYNCQTSAVFDQEDQTELGHVEDFPSGNQIQMPDVADTIEEDPDQSAINQSATGAAEDSEHSMCAAYPSPVETASDNAGAICNGYAAAEQQPLEEEEEASLDDAELDHLVPQQPLLSPYVNAYDYAQFYNTFYYPGCVMAPFPVVEDVYYNQVGYLSEEEYSKQFSFKKRKKWYRGWEEYPMEIHAEVLPEEVVSADQQEFTTSEVPAAEPISDNNNQTQLLPNQLPTFENGPPTPTPSAQTAPNAPVAQKSDNIIRSQPANSATRKTQKAHRKKDLIESTLAFAEQNIDLTKRASMVAPQQTPDSANVWRTVRNGKEIVEEDRELRYIDTRAMTKMEAIREELSETSCSSENTSLTQQSEASNLSGVSVNSATRQVKKEERISKKGKKTAKSKGKKQKRGNLGQQQMGFEVIEPEFVVSVTSFERVIEDVDEDGEDLSESHSLQHNASQQQSIGDLQEELETISLEQSEPQCDSIQEAVEQVLKNSEKTFTAEMLQNRNDYRAVLELEQELKNVQFEDLRGDEVCDILAGNVQHSLNVDTVDSDGACPTNTEESNSYGELPQDTQEQSDTLLTEEPSNEEQAKSNCVTLSESEKSDLAAGFPVAENSTCLTSASSKQESHCLALKPEEEDNDCKHFSDKEYTEDYDSGVQSPAVCVASTGSFGAEERKSSASSSYNDNDPNNLTEVVTSWLSETLRSKRLDEMFVLPDDPTLLGRIRQFAAAGFDDILALSSDTFSSSGEDAEDADSDYMSDVQVRNRLIDDQVLQHTSQKTDNEKLLDKQTENGHLLQEAIGGGHSNPKQKRCIIM